MPVERNYRIQRPTLTDRPTGDVVARLTVTRQSGLRTIVEIRSSATFSDFYRFYRQQGARRSTKELLRTSWRNEGIAFGIDRPGLDQIASRLQAFGAQRDPVTKTTLRIIKRRVYRRLLTCTPDQLGLTKERIRVPAQRFSPVSTPIAMVSN